MSNKYRFKINYNFSGGTNNNNNLLHDAATIGNYNLVEKLIEKGANVNGVNNIGSTPLFSAVKTNNLDIVRLLIEKGADVNLIPPGYINNPYFADQIRSNIRLCVPIETFQKSCIKETKKDPLSLEDFTDEDRINTVITPSNTCYNRNLLRTYYSTDQNRTEDPLRNIIPNKWRLDNLYEGPCDIKHENILNDIKNINPNPLSD